MRLREAYTLILLSNLPQGFEVPFRLEMDDGIFEITEVNENGKQATAFVERLVNPANLYIRTGPQPLDDSEPIRGIGVPEQTDLSQFLSRIINILSFLIDVPIRYAYKPGYERLIAETKEDREILQGFETQRIYVGTQVSVSVRSFSLAEISDLELRFLAERDVGLALYAQARLVQQPVAAFREFWRILESAFGTKDSDLIRLLSEFEPAKQLGFTQNELKSLLVLRGRASHAESRSGIREYQYVTKETSKFLPRLKCLVEQVILTKKTWGIQTLETERIARLDAFINSEGTPVLIKHTDSEESGS